MYIVIAGGGKIGSYLAGIMLKSGNEVAVIEQRLATADRLSVQLTGPYLVIHGDGCDSRYQEDAGIRQADVFVATTGQDDSNLVSCEIAQRVFRVPRCIARVNNPKNERIFRKVGIECVSSTTLIANLIEEEALLGSVSVVSLPDNAIIAAVASGGDVEVANDETVLHPGDKAIVVADEDVLDDVRLAFRGL